MYIWRNQLRRDKRNNPADGQATWVAPKGSENTTLQDEVLRQQYEKIFIDAFVQRIRVVMHEYLGTENGGIEINHVIHEMEDIHRKESLFAKKPSIPPQMKKRKNVYEVFRKFDTDGSDSIDCDELNVLLQHLGVNMEKEQLDILLTEINPSKSGEINFDEFYNWFEKEGEKQQKASSSIWKKFDVFSSKKQNEANLYQNFKRMIMEVEARNLILDKVLYETERDALIEFRIAHPPLYPCQQCTDCFLSPQDCTFHMADTEYHTKKEAENREKVARFIPVDNVLCGPFGRKLVAHRLLFSVELNGLQSRLNVVQPQPYRPNLSDPEGKRAEQLRKGTLVLGSDARAGIRPLYSQYRLDKQHRQVWGQEHEQLSLQDTMTYLINTHDKSIDVIFSTGVSQHLEVHLSWKGYIRYSVSIIGEFNGWKPVPIYPDDMGVYTHTVMLAPGRYQYRFIADGIEAVEPTASSMTSSDGVLNNVILVLNPYQKDPSRDKRMKDLLPSHLNIRNTYLYADGAWALADSIRQSNSHILYFDVSHNHISDEGMMAIAEACSHLPNLHTLKLNNNSFTYDGVRYLTSVYQSSLTLARLELCNNRIGNDGAELLAKIFAHHSSLKEVFLDCNYIGDDGATELGQALQANNTIEHLSLAGNQIRIRGIERFCYYLRYNGCLKELNLSQNPLGPEGGKYVGEMLLSNNTLRILDVSHVQLVLNKQQQGLLSITEGIKRNRGLHTMIMKGNNLNNDHALEIAYGLSNNHNIRTFDLADNPIVSQWFEPNTYLKTKLLAKMPTIRTSLDRNMKILENPVLAQRYIPQDPIMDAEHEGQWNRRRIWKTSKKSRHQPQQLDESLMPDSLAATSLDKASQPQKPISSEEEEKRIKAEETYIAENLYKYAVTLTVFLNSPDGKITLKYLSKLISSYFHQLSLPMEERESWTDTVQLGVITEMLLLCQKEVKEIEKQKHLQEQLRLEKMQKEQVLSKQIEPKTDETPTKSKKKTGKAKSTPQILTPTPASIKSPRELKRQESAALPDQYRPPEEEALLTTIVPPSAHEELQQTISPGAIELFYLKLNLHLPASQIEEIITECRAPKPSHSHHRHHHDDQITPTHESTHSSEVSIHLFYQYFLTHQTEYFLPGLRSYVRELFQFSPISLASELIYHHHINERRIFYRQQYRNDPSKLPLYYCQVCGQRYATDRHYKRHYERSKKEHQKYFHMEEIWLSQDRLINHAKTKQVGVHFPAYYILGDMRLMPKYFTPQVFDDLGEEGRPIGVIEPDLTYRVNDLLGIWIQIKYNGGIGWTRYRIGALTIMTLAMNHIKGFWDQIENYPKPIFYAVSDVLPDGVQIKVRQKPDMDATVCGTLEKGMVVRCEAKCENWLQIHYNEFDAAWVMEKSGDIVLMDRLHEYVQQRLPNYMNQNSPVIVPSKIIELTKDELREELLKKRELKREAEQKAAEEKKARKEQERLLEESTGGKKKKRRETMNKQIQRKEKTKEGRGDIQESKVGEENGEERGMQ